MSLDSSCFRPRTGLTPHALATGPAVSTQAREQLFARAPTLATVHRHKEIWALPIGPIFKRMFKAMLLPRPGANRHTLKRNFSFNNTWLLPAAQTGHPAFAECLQCWQQFSTGKPGAHFSLYSAPAAELFSGSCDTAIARGPRRRQPLVLYRHYPGTPCLILPAWYGIDGAGKNRALLMLYVATGRGCAFLSSVQWAWLIHSAHAGQPSTWPYAQPSE